MTDTILLFRRQLGKRLSKFGYKEDRIVTKPVLATRHSGDYALDYSLNDTSRARWVGQGDCTAKTCCASIHRKPIQLRQYPAETLFIRCFPAKVASGSNPWSASERVYL